MMQPTRSAVDDDGKFAVPEAPFQAIHFLSVTGEGSSDVENVHMRVVEGDRTLVKQSLLVAVLCIRVVTGGRKKERVV